MVMKANAKNLTGSMTTRTLIVGAMIVAMIAASLLAPSRAQASAFPGANGKIVFSSNRSTGTGVDNPENINRLSEGRHAFAVRALDEKGNVDPTPATWIWAVEENG